MLTVAMVMLVAVTAVRAAFGLERNLHLHELRSETVEHILDHMVWANAKGIIPNLGWHGLGECEGHHPESRLEDGDFPGAKRGASVDGGPYA